MRAVKAASVPTNPLSSEDLRRDRTWTFLIALGLFVACFFLYTRHNNFPFYYHTDEPLEIELVLKGTVNFHHPLLMGNTTDLLMRLGGVERTRQNVALVGRGCSAFFGAVAVVALALLAARYHGAMGALCAGTLVGIHPLLFELTHYYKEDPALLMGLALSFLAMSFCWRRPGWASCLLLGLANALAVSGKYMGIIAALIALPVLLAAPTGDRTLSRGARFACWLGAFLLGIGLVNYQLVSNLPVFVEGLGRELYFVKAGGNQGVSQSVPHDKYVGTLQGNTRWAMWIFIAGHFAYMWRTRSRRDLVEWILTFFPIILGLVLTFTPKTAGRYFLPVSAVTCYLGGVGIVETWRHLIPPLRWHPLLAWRPLATACLILVAGVLSRQLMKEYRAFLRDSRDELAQWINANVPQSAIIAEDKRVNLPHPGHPFAEAMRTFIKQKVVTKPFVADLGTIEELRARGIDYVAINESGIFKKNRLPAPEFREDYVRRKTFYDRLAKDGELLWEKSVRQVLPLHPSFKLYRLPASEKKVAGETSSSSGAE